MAILKVQPNAIDTTGNFAVGAVTTTGNVTVGGQLIVNNTILPTTANVIDIGTPTMRFGTLYLAGNTIDLGGTLISTDPVGTLTFTTETGNVAITANTVSFLNTVANTSSESGSVAFDGNVNAYAIYTDSYFYANGTPFTGARGYTGSTGSGYTGSAGTAGYTGSAGTSGSAGAQGYTGSAGTGYTGSAGAQGPAGGGFINLDMAGTIDPPYTGTARFYPPNNITINTVYANLSANPTGGNLTFVIKKNGTSIGTVFSLSAALMTPVSVNVALTTTDYLTVDVTGTVSAADLNIKLKYV